MSITPVSGPKMKAAGGLLVFEKVPDPLYPASKVVQELHDPQLTPIPTGKAS